MRHICYQIILGLNKLRHFPLLFFRLILSYGFFKPAMMKINNLPATIKFFQTIGIPFPELGAWLAMITEASGVILLFLGLFTRLISLPMMFLLGVAISTVHWKYGFSAGANGYEIPLYYLAMLFALFILGPGGISIDAIIRKKWIKSSHPKD